MTGASYRRGDRWPRIAQRQLVPLPRNCRDRIGTKRSIYISLAVYAFISVVAYWMTEPWQFWVLAGLVGTVPA